MALVKDMMFYLFTYLKFISSVSCCGLTSPLTVLTKNNISSQNHLLALSVKEKVST